VEIIQGNHDQSKFSAPKGTQHSDIYPA